MARLATIAVALLALLSLLGAAVEPGGPRAGDVWPVSIAIAVVYAILARNVHGGSVVALVAAAVFAAGGTYLAILDCRDAPRAYAFIEVALRGAILIALVAAIPAVRRAGATSRAP